MAGRRFTEFTEMDISSGGARPALSAESFETGHHLANARRQAEAQGLDDVLVIDADAHIYEKESITEIIALIEEPIIRQLALSAQGAARQAARFPLDNVAYHDTGGRITRDLLRNLEATPKDGTHRAAHLALRAMDAMGIDIAALSPFGLQIMGTHPQPEVEAAVLGAYNRWLTEQVLPCSPRLLGWIVLPFNAPEAALKLVETYAETPGVAGFQVASLRRLSVHANAFMPIYAAIEQSGLPLAFHGGIDWDDPMFKTFNKFMAVHALSPQWYNIVHCTNWLVNGMPERFPEMPVIWMDSGISWVPWLMMRIDNEYRMRSSECPSLRRLPGEYMREMCYTSNPVEMPDHTDMLAAAYRAIDAPNSLIYASNYPAADMDLPGAVNRLDFLNQAERRKILGETARKLFRLPETVQPDATAS